MKLEDIKKKNIYTVPDKYFDQLPTRIQSRVNEKKGIFGLSPRWIPSIRIAVLSFAIVLILFLYGLPTNDSLNPEQLLAQVETEDLIAYLETTDITTEDIIEELDLSTIELDFYEDGPIMQDMDMDDDEIDALFDEFGIDAELL